MDNIPTDLLRTLVAIVDHRSYTRAAQTLGITQPAVSSQIKRLQGILGTDLFDRSGPGICLTAKGEIIVKHARQLLLINDRILRFAEANACKHVIRIGLPSSDFATRRLTDLIADFCKRWPDLRFRSRQGSLDQLLIELRQGNLDLAVGLSRDDCGLEARHRWIERMAWLRAPATELNPTAPVPLVSFREDCIYYRTAVHALSSFGRASELVFASPTLGTLEAAVDAGLGIMAMGRTRATATSLIMWDDAPLPALPELCGGIYLRDGGQRDALEDLADLFASRLRPAAEPGEANRKWPTLITVSPPVGRHRAAETMSRKSHPVSAASRT